MGKVKDRPAFQHLIRLIDGLNTRIEDTDQCTRRTGCKGPEKPYYPGDQGGLGCALTGMIDSAFGASR